MGSTEAFRGSLVVKHFLLFVFFQMDKELRGR